MDPDDLNELSDYSERFVYLKSRFELALEQVGECEIFFNQQNPLLSSLKADFNQLVSLNFFFGGTNLQDIAAAFLEVDNLMIKANTIIEDMTHNKGLAKIRIELTTILFKGKAVLQETMDFIESFEEMTLLLCDTANDLEKKLTEIEKSLRSLRQTYNITY
ncbi:hypothetical protein TNIN_361311 [Trichonephila inaurata madagascariensis]|uniref:Uncharacterized protein n=1 Tax=Trichonephila inaurata madagascariensis TaxID=2747483 RepID=A0A8X6Y5L3_9ARAC|nr:hypothetical protein TNIN_361311 [Trichonephila inaurata madagascariensis]